MALDETEQLEALEKAGISYSLFGDSEARRFQSAAESKSNPAVLALSKAIGEDKTISKETEKQFLTALGQKWKADPAVFTNLEADLKANPALATEIQNTIKTDPNRVLAAIGQYTGGNLSAVLAQKPENSPAPSVSDPVGAFAAESTEMLNNDYEPLKKKMSPEQQALFDDALSTRDENGQVRTREQRMDAWEKLELALVDSPEIDTELTTFRQKYPDWVLGSKGFKGPAYTQPAPEPNSAPTQTAQNSPNSKQNNQSLSLFAQIAGASDEELDSLLTEKNIKLIAPEISKMAKEKYGVPEATADAFAEKIKRDPNLAKAISNNLRNNPEFVRQFAKMAGDDSPMSDSIKQKAQQEMNALMERPELLASDKYVQDMQNKMKMADNFKNFSLGGMLDGLMSMFKQWMGKFMDFISGFTGKNSVLSLASGGGGLFPTLLVNQDNIERNRNEARAWNTASVNDMTPSVFRKDRNNGATGGLAASPYFHDGAPIKDAQGKQVMKDGKPQFEQVPNGQITVKTADGKDVKVIPATGALLAQQLPGTMQGNKYIAGNIEVPVVTAINENGAPSNIQKITMTPEAFAAYKAIADADGAKRGGAYTTVAFKPYTEADYQDALERTAPAQLAKVDKDTGQVTVVQGSQQALLDQKDLQRKYGTDAANAPVLANQA